ncbi:cyclin-dependent kinase inhibitor 4-like [Canna indica]|uniref:Cyclin-dependent kinase inhibitor n=1 Tax=Canna indica TaxID=4628 RepID=A0AAQ3KQ72_9LILI|nr:cyclin-dependent kinase inhibitor 4-like [Canna indica]
MGKYMRKAKVSGEVAVMEVSHQNSLGVRTRARTLAAAAAQDSSRAYLELRSRRLEKPLTPPPDTAKPNLNPNPKPESGLRSQKSNSTRRENSGSVGSASARRCLAGTPSEAEVSLGENILEIDAIDRYDRETTPCSLIRNPEAIQTPGSTNRSTYSTAANRRMQSVHHNIPTANEMEEFFSGAEQLQQRIFIERYNFDPVNDHPLPGRYEWVKVDF